MWNIYLSNLPPVLRKIWSGSVLEAGFVAHSLVIRGCPRSGTLDKAVEAMGSKSVVMRYTVVYLD